MTRLLTLKKTARPTTRSVRHAGGKAPLWERRLMNGTYCLRVSTPETSPSAQLTPQQRANLLARWANRARERYMTLNSKKKVESNRATGLGRETVDRVLRADLSKGPPKPGTIDAIAAAWGADADEAHAIMRKKQPPRLPIDPPPATSVEARRVLALLAAPDELISKARKRRINIRLDSIYREDAEEALLTGQPTLDDVEALPQVASTMDDLAKPTG